MISLGFLSRCGRETEIAILLRPGAVVPGPARAVSGLVLDCRRCQSGLARDFPSSQTRLNLAKTRSSRIARCDCVIDKKRRAYDNGEDLARKTTSAWRHLGGKWR